MNSPYRYLNFFREDDDYLFFGRRKEIEILLSDVTISRLVVLFAKTGTGKTSLIRAGVTPRLKELGYATIYTRVKDTPVKSLAHTLAKREIPVTQDMSFEEQCLIAHEHLGKRPLVLFFDQFEEFFFTMDDRPWEETSQFINQVARILQNRDPRVHIVFSLREDFLGEMDIFRQVIPTIFHKDSNLRLLPFDRQQARLAIVEPAKRFDPPVTINSNVVEAILDDLEELSIRKRIEPAQLEIVCDTLWQRRPGDIISKKFYDQAGGAGQILVRRLEDDLGASLDEGQLELFQRLADLLTDRKRETKRPRLFDELMNELGVDFHQLASLVDNLNRLHLVRQKFLESTVYVEWVTDYVARIIDTLDQIVIRLLTKKRLDRFLESARFVEEKRQQIRRSDDPEEMAALRGEVTRQQDNLPQDFAAISDQAGQLELDLDSESAGLLLRKSLEYRVDMAQWFAIAQDAESDAWKIVEDLIDGASPADETLPAAISGLYLLAQVGGERAFDLLGQALEKPFLAPEAIPVLGEQEDGQAVELLARAAEDEELVERVIPVLGNSEPSLHLLGQIFDRNLEKIAGLMAGRRLYELSLFSEDRIAGQARQIFDDLAIPDAGRLFSLSLEAYFDARFWFSQAGEEAWRILNECIDDLDRRERAANSVTLLGEVGDMAAVELLEQTFRYNDLAFQTAGALQRIIETRTRRVAADRQRYHQASTSQTKQAAKERASLKRSIEADDKIVARARKVLDRWEQGEAEPQSPSLIKMPTRNIGFESRSGPVLWDYFVSNIAYGKVTPIVGPGAVSGGTLSQIERIARRWVIEYEYPWQPEPDFSKMAEYVSVLYGRDYARHALIKELERIEPPDLEEEDNPLSILAKLPFSVYITTDFGDSLARELTKSNKQPRTWLAGEKENWEDGTALSTDYSPYAGEPLVGHLLGHVEYPASLALTEGDYHDFLITTSRNRQAISPIVAERLADTSLLLIGLQLADPASSVLLKFLELFNRRHFDTKSIFVYPESSSDLARQSADYLTRYLGQHNMEIYWGSAEKFTSELWERWVAFQSDPNAKR